VALSVPRRGLHRPALEFLYCLRSGPRRQPVRYRLDL